MTGCLPLDESASFWERSPSVRSKTASCSTWEVELTSGALASLPFQASNFFLSQAQQGGPVESNKCELRELRKPELPLFGVGRRIWP